MSLDQEGSARHKQMDQEHILEQVRPRFIDLTTDKMTAHRIVRVIMRGHEKKLGCFMPTPKGAMERGQKDVYNMFTACKDSAASPRATSRPCKYSSLGCHSTERRPETPVVMPLSMTFLAAMTSAACSTHLPIMTRPSLSMRTRWGYQTATLMK